MGLKYLYLPSGVQAGTAYGVLPNSADADFDDFARSSAGSRVDKNGLINTGLGLGSEWFDSSNINDRDNATNTTNSDATITTELNTSNIGWSISATSILNQDKIYKVEWKIISTNSNSGTFFYWNGVEQGGFGDLTQEGSGVYYLKGNASGTNADIRFNNAQPNSTITWSLSIREVVDVNTDVPRLDHTGGGCPSLLLEPQSTNYLTYSEDFSQSYWSKSNSSFSDYSGLSPQGTYNAKTITDSGAGGVSGVHFNRYSLGGALPSDGDYTYSIFAKKGARKLFRFRVGGLNGISDAVADFNLDTGVVFATSGTPFNSTSIHPYKDGWYRISVSLTITNLLSSQYVRVRMLSDNGSTSLNLDGTNTMHFFGAQVENGNATSYIPTFGALKTRSEDVGGSTGDLSSVVNSQEGTFMFEGSFLSIGGRVGLNSSTTTWSDRITILTISDTQIKVILKGGNVGEDATFTVPNIKTNGKLAIRWIGTNVVGYYNGTQVFSKANNGGYSAGILDRISMAGANGTSNKFTGKIKQLRIDDEYLSDAEMVKLTTL